jgi:hypothetical protein
MGCPIRSIDGLLDSIDAKHKDWCLVLLLDRDRLTPAGRQMIELLTDFDEDSGAAFDFYLPGYSTEPVAGSDDDHRRILYGETLVCVNVARIERLGELNFSRQDFRTFYKQLERFLPNRWRWSGGCELLLFRRNCGVRPSGAPSNAFCRGRDFEIAEFCAYNLEDVVNNGCHVQQFVRKLCNILEERHLSDAQLDWVSVKRTVDDVYRELILPPKGDVVLSGVQCEMQSVSRDYLAKNFPDCSYVFVSHSSKDVEFARAVRDALEKCGARCWMAPRDIPTGTNYAYMISGALGKCGMLLFLLSANSMDSVWCAKELQFRFAELQREGRLYVAWCAPRVKLGSEYAFALNNVQIDGSRDAQEIAGNIISAFYGRGLANARETETTAWVKAMHDDRRLATCVAFVDNCPWDRFSGRDWVDVLTDNYDLNARIRFDLLSADDSAQIISAFPALEDRCDWSRIADDFPWGKVKRHPELIRHFPVRSNNADAWLSLLRACSDASFVDWLRLNDLFGVSHWVRLIVARPELADKCRQWDQLSRADWNFLLSRRPEVARHCDAVNGWSLLSDSDWSHVIRHEPGFVGKRRAEHVQINKGRA